MELTYLLFRNMALLCSTVISQWILLMRVSYRKDTVQEGSLPSVIVEDVNGMILRKEYIGISLPTGQDGCGG